jgi:hypothetical protein
VSDRVVVRSASVEAAKVLTRRNRERGKPSDSATVRLAGARYVAPEEPNGSDTNGSTSPS